MYAEAGRSRTGELGKPRHGIGRLALESGAPVVPTAIAGTERARNWKRLQFPKVTIQFGEPLRFEQVTEPTKEQAQAASEIVFDRVREMHGKLVGEGRKSAVRRRRASNRRAAAGLAVNTPRSVRAGVLIGAVAAAFLALPSGAAFACDPLDPSACMYPWPNDHFTRADASSPDRQAARVQRRLDAAQPARQAGQLRALQLRATGSARAT